VKHRHLVENVGHTPAAIEDILDRGTPRDWMVLRDAARAEPHGKIAETILAVCASNHMYGTSNLWRAFIASLRESR